MTRKNQKKKPLIIQKPTYKGKVVEITGSKRAVKVFGSMMLILVLYLIFGPMLMVQNNLVRIVLNAVLLLLAMGILSITGSSDGEADAAFGEIVYQRKEEGKEVTKADEARSFNPLRGFYTAYLGAGVFFVLAVILAVFTKVETYSLGVLPGWVQSYTGQSSVGQGLAYYDIVRSIAPMDIIRMVVRASTFPFFTMFNTSPQAAVFLERLTPFFVLIVPTGYALGYLRGKKIRGMIHGSIAQGVKKKKKKANKERKARQRRVNEPEQLV